MQNHTPKGLFPLRISTSDAHRWLHKSDIVRIEAVLKKTKIFTAMDQEPIMTNHGLQFFEKLFIGNEHFFRCHRAHIINMEHIKTFIARNRMISTLAGNVPLARKKLRPFREQYCRNRHS